MATQEMDEKDYLANISSTLEYILSELQSNKEETVKALKKVQSAIEDMARKV